MPIPKVTGRKDPDLDERTGRLVYTDDLKPVSYLISSQKLTKLERYKLESRQMSIPRLMPSITFTSKIGLSTCILIVMIAIFAAVGAIELSNGLLVLLMLLAIFLMLLVLLSLERQRREHFSWRLRHTEYPGIKLDSDLRFTMLRNANPYVFEKAMDTLIYMQEAKRSGSTRLEGVNSILLSYLDNAEFIVQTILLADGSEGAKSPEYQELVQELNGYVDRIARLLSDQNKVSVIQLSALRLRRQLSST